MQKTAVFGTLPDMSPTGNTALLAHHQGHHSGEDLSLSSSDGTGHVMWHACIVRLAGTCITGPHALMVLRHPLM